MRLIETTAELGRSSGRTAIVGEAAGFLYHARGGLRSTSMHTVTRFCPVFGADLEDEAFHEIELEIAGANAEANNVATDKEDLSEETNKRAVTLVPGLPTGT
jgi:hypothetical protein